MPAKLAVKRFTSGTSHIGDVVGIYDESVYLGSLVEPKGGAYSIIIVSDADRDHPELQKLLEIHAEENLYDRKLYLNPVTDGAVFDELLNTGRYTANLAELITYVREH